MTNRTRFFRVLLFFLLLLFCCGPVSGDLRMTVLDVGQGLSVLFESDGHYALYDGGGRETSSRVVSRLKREGIEEIDLLIASHYDEDHIAGLIGVMNVFSCGTILSTDADREGALFDSFNRTIEEKAIPREYPVPGAEYEFGGAEIRVLGASNYETDDNNNSLAVRVLYENTAVMIGGDAQYEEEMRLVETGQDLTADVLIVNHHGSASSTCPDYLSAVAPTWAVISCGRDNTYGHPTESVLERLNSCGIEIFRTDLQGEITAESDGNWFFFDVVPSEDLTPGNAPETDDVLTETPAAGEEGSKGEVSVTYIGNKNSKVFHDPGCGSVDQMKEKNKVYFYGDREEVTGSGFRPCQNCHP